MATVSQEHDVHSQEVVEYQRFIEDQLRILDKVLRSGIVIRFELDFHGSEIHRLPNDIVVIRNIISTHGV